MNTDRGWTEAPLFDADWNPDDGEQLGMFGELEQAGPVKLWPEREEVTA